MPNPLLVAHEWEAKFGKPIETQENKNHRGVRRLKRIQTDNFSYNFITVQHLPATPSLSPHHRFVRFVRRESITVKTIACINLSHKFKFTIIKERCLAI